MNIVKILKWLLGIGVLICVIFAAAFVYNNHLQKKDFIRNSNSTTDKWKTYTNSSFGYSINIQNGYTYQESKNEPGGLFVYNLTEKENDLDVNIFAAPNSADNVPANATTQINGQTAKIISGIDEHSRNRKTYQILHNGMIYEITFAPLNDPRLQSMAQSFLFTK